MTVLRRFTALAFLSFLFGCASLQPGADPVVVRAEQTQVGVEAAFDLIVKIDHLDRGFWRTNAPAFHDFVEKLRAPVPVAGLPGGRPTLPRYIAVQWELDRAKLHYKAAKSAAGSNAVMSAVLAVEGLAQQTGAWLTIITNRP